MSEIALSTGVEPSFNRLPHLAGARPELGAPEQVNRLARLEWSFVWREKIRG